MRHRIGERALEKALVRDGCFERRVAEVGVQRGEGVVEARYLVGKSGESRRREGAAVQHGARIPDHSRHVPDQLVRRPYVGRNAEVSKAGWSATQRLLRTIGERGEEVPE